jgi:hypothetical protein
MICKKNQGSWSVPTVMALSITAELQSCSRQLNSLRCSALLHYLAMQLREAAVLLPTVHPADQQLLALFCASARVLQAQYSYLSTVSGTKVLLLSTFVWETVLKHSTCEVPWLPL